MRALSYFLEEAAASLWRGRRSSLLSVVTIAAALFILGAFLLASVNVERTLVRWTEAAELSVYLSESATAIERAAIERILDESGLVAGREYVSRAQALERFRRDFADLAGALDDGGESPFPASYEVRLGPDGRDGDAVDALARRLDGESGVADVRYDQRWIDRLLMAIGLARGLGVLVVAILIFAAALTVSNVVRLACHARRDEIEIMYLVGAPIAYIRGPFVMEGVLQGGAGALLALGPLWLAFLGLQGQWGRAAADVLGVAEPAFLSPALCLLLLAGGMLVGCIGGFVASRSATG